MSLWNCVFAMHSASTVTEKGISIESLNETFHAVINHVTFIHIQTINKSPMV